MDGKTLLLVGVGVLLFFGFMRARAGDADGDPAGGMDRSDLDDYPRQWILQEAREIERARTQRTGRIDEVGRPRPAAPVVRGGRRALNS